MSNLPDYKPTFPNWPNVPLSKTISTWGKGTVDPAGIELLSVCPSLHCPCHWPCPCDAATCTADPAPLPSLVCRHSRQHPCLGGPVPPCQPPPPLACPVPRVRLPYAVPDFPCIRLPLCLLGATCHTCSVASRCLACWIAWARSDISLPHPATASRPLIV